MRMKGRILFVEDEADLTLIVSNTLRQEGYEVVCAVDGMEGLSKFMTEEFDIVVADVMMPRMDGFSMAREIRQISTNIPLLFLTAKSSVDDVEEGFELGANDYIKKPFELRELFIRIKALLRRNPNGCQEKTIFHIGEYTFYTATQTLSYKDRENQLSHFESKILELLASNIGNTVDASKLMIAVWERDDPSNRNSLHGYIHKLRRLLRHDKSISIINQRGFGYMLVVNV